MTPQMSILTIDGSTKPQIFAEKAVIFWQIFAEKAVIF